MVSGNAALFRGPYDHKENLYKLKKEQFYKGVLITIRVPYPQNQLARGEFYEYTQK